METEKTQKIPPKKEDIKQETDAQDKVAKIGRIISDLCEMLKNLPD